jgi:hypothetical protein
MIEAGSGVMSNASRRMLAGSAALAGVGFVLLLSAPSLTARMHLSQDGGAALFPHRTSGIWLWLALAWLAARCFIGWH